MAEHGLLTNVSWSWGGTETTVAASLGDTAITVLNPDPISIGDLVYLDNATDTTTIVDADYDTGILTITPPLVAALEENVPVVPDQGGEPMKVWIGEVVMVTGEEPIEVELSWEQAQMLSEGEVSPPRPVQMTNDLTHILNLPGQSTGGGGNVKAWQDMLTVAVTGVQTLTLTYLPIPDSEHLYWNGAYQPGSEWSRTNWDVLISDAPTGLITVGDQFVMEYLHNGAKLDRPPISQKLYLQSSGAPSISPGFGAQWEYTSNAVRRPMVVTPGGTALGDASATYTISGTSDVLCAQMVGAALPFGRIKGNFRISLVVFGGGGSLTSAQATYMQVVIRVVDSVGVEKAILYAGQAFTSSSVVNTDPNYRWADQANNRVLSGALTTYDTTAGDRLVVELGGRNCLGPGTWGAYPVVRLGDPAAADLLFAADTFLGTERPWIEVGV